MIDDTIQTQDSTATPAGDDELHVETHEADESETRGEKLLTQAEVDAIVADRLKRDRAKRRTKPAPRKPTPAEPDIDLVSELQEMKLLRQFDRATSGINLHPAKRDVLEKLFKVDRPEDPVAWAQEQAELFGFGSEDKKPEPAQEQASQLPAGQKPVTARTAPSTDKRYVEAEDSLEWPHETVTKMVSEKGIKWVRAKFEEDMRKRNIIRG